MVSTGQCCGVAVMLGLVLAWICTMVGMGGSLHEVEIGSAKTSFFYNKAESGGVSTSYKDCKDASELCEKCYDGGAVWITLQVGLFLTLLACLILCTVRSLGFSAKLSFSSPHALFTHEWRMYVAITLMFLIANIAWGSTCFGETVDWVSDIATSYTINTTGYGFSLFMFWYMLILTCVMSGAPQRDPTWLTPFSSSVVAGGAPTTVVVSSGGQAVPVAQPVAGGATGSPPMGYAVGPQPAYGAPVGQPVAYGQPQPQYGAPVAQPMGYGAQPQYGAPVYGQPQEGQPQYGVPQGQPQYGVPQGQPQYGVPQGQPQYGAPQQYGAPPQSSAGEI